MLPLVKRYLSDEDAQRLYAKYGSLRGSYEEYCPTCLKRNGCKYTWQGVEHDCDCQQQLQLHKHYLNAGIGVNYQRLTWDDFKGSAKLRSTAEDYMALHHNLVPRGMGLLMLGSNGTGKTMVANLMMKDLLHKGYSVYATTFAEMIDTFAAGWRDPADKRYFESRVRMSEVLLIDDLGKEYTTKTGLEKSAFDTVMRSRVQGGRPTFITTNLGISELGSDYGASINSLISESSLQVEAKGQDYRQTARNRTIAEAGSGETRPIV